MSEKELRKWLNYVFLFIFFLVLIITALIQLIRLIRKIKSQYHDWVYILCWVLYLACFVCAVISHITNQFGSLECVIASTLTTTWGWTFMLGFEMMTTAYPALLILYCSKLSCLLKGGKFDSIKKNINRIEIFVIVFVPALMITSCIFELIVYILLYQNTWYLLGDSVKKNHTASCDKIFSVGRVLTTYIGPVIIVFLLISQVLIYFKLKKTMKTRLHYFYHKVKKNIKVLFISNGEFYENYCSAVYEDKTCP